MAMKHCVEQYRIDHEGGIDTWRLDEFARQCGTKIAPIFPIFIVLTDGKLSAYFYAQPLITIRPTVAPESEWDGKAFYQTARAVVQGTQQMFGNPIWFVDPNSRLANSKLMAKVGLIARDLKVFEVR